MLSKARLNFVVDAMIFVAFIAATLSGVILLTMPQGGFRGGRNPAFYQTVLLLNRSGWNDVHVWASLALLVGIGVHVVLHWKWIVCMAKRLTRARNTALPDAIGGQPCPVPVKGPES